MILSINLETALSRDCSSHKYLYLLELFRNKDDSFDVNEGP